MFEDILKDQETKDRYSKKAFAREIDLYLNWMHQQGYAPNTMRKRLFGLIRFSDYLDRHGVKAIEAVPLHAGPFVTAWVRKSKRKGETKNPERLAREVNSDVRQFLGFLEGIGKIKADPVPASGLDSSLQKIFTEFADFYRTERGLAEPTINLYSLYVHRFLIHVQTTGVLACSQWNRQTLYDYLTKEGVRTGRRGMHCVCSALRSLFRFLLIKGQPLTPGLNTFPRPRIYTQESLPRFLHADQVQQVLKSVDRTTPQGIRDYAILVLLISYGMRASEVVRLSLDDLDWAGGKIHLKNRKTRRSDVFPLTAQPGEAILEYLQKVRPGTKLRQVFLSLFAPFRPFYAGNVVSSIARKYLLASGVPLPDRVGAHLFRHSFSHQLLASGMSYKFIGDFLGHSSVSSTSVYLKVDIDRLRQVGLNDGEDLL